MAKNKRKRRRSVKSKKSKPFFKVWLMHLLFWAVLSFVFVFVFYLGYLDYRITHQFEGKRWAVPARVYASPEELYAGYPYSATAFAKQLEILRYRKDPGLSSQATYYRKGRQIFVKTRGFRFWERQAPSRRLRLVFSSNRLESIFDLEQSRDLPILRLDPIQIGSFYPTRKQDRILIKLEQAPDFLVQGLLATEDRHFYQHYGISFRAVLRALWANIRAGGIVQGGSTITQQLVKNFYLTPERSWWRKFNEALMALILDARYKKAEILEAFLNEIYLGQDGSRAIHGFGLASEYYFGRPLSDLKLEGNALLIALVRGPSYYNPWKHPERAVSRRNRVIDAMHERGDIPSFQANTAKNRPLALIRKKHSVAHRYTSFMALVKRQLRQEYREQDLTSEGLRIFTTLQVNSQKALEKTVIEVLNNLEKNKRVAKLQTAAVITRREGGEVVAMVGERSSGYAGFNRALDALRPIGSLIKPVIYLTALDNPERYTLTTLLDDTEIQVKLKKGKTWKPKNYDLIEHGPVPLHTALANSYNLATVRLGMDLGLVRSSKTLRNLGVHRQFKLYPSFLLGAVALSPFEVTQIFQTLASDGFNTPLRSIRAVLSGEGKPLQRYPLTVRQVADPAATYLLNTILQEVMREGTGRSIYSILPKSFNVAGKTGTTNDLRDSWFAGFTGDYLGTVWLGRDDNKPIYLSGSRGALKVWARVMKKISKQPVDLLTPEDIELIWIDLETGLKGNQQCADAVKYPFIKGSAPEEFSSCAENPLDNARSWLRKLFSDD